MSGIIGALVAEFWPYVAGLAIIVAGFFGIRRSGVKSERDRAEAKAAKEAIETRSRIDAAIENSRAGGGDWHDRLSRLQPTKRKR